MQVCVTGANGFIGRYLVEALSRQGHSIRVLTRQYGNIFPANIEVMTGDLTRSDCALDKFLDGCEVLFHCAGEIHNVQLMHALHVEGTKRLLQTAVKECARIGRGIHWVQLSSVGAYGPPVGQPKADRTITENTKTNPANQYEVTKTMSDELVVNASENNNSALTYTILRPSNVFSSKMTNQSLRRLIELVKNGLFFYVGKHGAVTIYIHVADVVAALIVCAIDPRAKGQIYNLSSDCILEDLIRHIAMLLRVRNPWLRIPESVINIPLAILSTLLKKWVKVPTFNVPLVRTRYPTQKIDNELGFKFSKPVAAGIDDLVKEFV
jgi:nucleoside-diphosphate-sugar epimerase